MENRLAALDIAGPLSESMDQSIGEASSMMGVVMQEMLRRSLRGGVLRIGEQLETYVAETVDTSLQEQKPHIEQLAVGAAARAAEQTAGEVANRELRSVNHRIDQTDQKVEERANSVAQLLGGRLEETQAQLQGQIHATVQTNAERLAEVEQRVVAANQAQLQECVQQLSERSKKNGAVLRARHDILERALTKATAELIELKQQLLQLQLRVVELETPRGLQAFWLWLFPRRGSES